MSHLGVQEWPLFLFGALLSGFGRAVLAPLLAEASMTASHVPSILCLLVRKREMKILSFVSLVHVHVPLW